ncbi:MAG: hypothetical protein ACWA47_12715 [Brevirhabdus sp.]
MGLIRLVILGFLLMTAAYFLISVYSKSVRRERLEKEWDAENPDGDDAARANFVEQGMEEYHSGFRKKLIWLVYVIPTVLVISILFLTNSN